MATRTGSCSYENVKRSDHCLVTGRVCIGPVCLLRLIMKNATGSVKVFFFFFLRGASAFKLKVTFLVFWEKVVKNPTVCFFTKGSDGKGFFLYSVLDYDLVL